MKVLFATSEMADFIKAGGLGEVSAGLTRALRHQGADVRVLIPGYPGVLARCPDLQVLGALPGRAGIPPCRIGLSHTIDGMPVYVVLSPALFERRGSPTPGRTAPIGPTTTSASPASPSPPPNSPRASARSIGAPTCST